MIDITMNIIIIKVYVCNNNKQVKKNIISGKGCSLLLINIIVYVLLVFDLD